jgi:hypothetical protein
MANGIAFAGQMLIPIYLIRACGLSPSATGWLLAPLGLGMMCCLPVLGNFDEALRHSQSVRWRRASGFRRDAAFSLAGKPRTGARCTRVRALYPRHGPERSRYAVDSIGIRLGQASRNCRWPRPLSISFSASEGRLSRLCARRFWHGDWRQSLSMSRRLIPLPRLFCSFALYTLSCLWPR